MKNKVGVISGFVLGVSGFLLIFKLIFLDRIPREDEVPPSVVVFASMLNGLLLAYIGSVIQNYFRKKTTN